MCERPGLARALLAGIAGGRWLRRVAGVALGFRLFVLVRVVGVLPDRGSGASDLGGGILELLGFSLAPSCSDGRS